MLETTENAMRKGPALLTPMLTLALALLLALAPVWAAPPSAQASANDPLISRSWCDDALELGFAPLRSQLAAIRAAIIGARQTSVTLYINSATYLVNGESRTMDTAPIVNADWRTMVPIRFVAEALGCQVDYTTRPDGRTDQVLINGTSALALTVNSAAYLVDGEARQMDTAPVVNADSRTLVPIRFVAEALGCQVSYETDAKGATTTVHISK